MLWETNLRKPSARTTRWKRHYEWNYLAIVLMFFAFAVASIALGVYRGASGGIPTDSVTVGALGALVLAASIFGLFLILRQMASVCHTQGILRFLRRNELKESRATAPT